MSSILHGTTPVGMFDTLKSIITAALKRKSWHDSLYVKNTSLFLFLRTSRTFQVLGRRIVWVTSIDLHKSQRLHPTCGEMKIFTTRNKHVVYTFYFFFTQRGGLRTPTHHLFGPGWGGPKTLTLRLVVHMHKEHSFFYELPQKQSFLLKYSTSCNYDPFSDPPCSIWTHKRALKIGGLLVSKQKSNRATKWNNNQQLSTQ